MGRSANAAILVTVIVGTLAGHWLPPAHGAATRPGAGALTPAVYAPLPGTLGLDWQARQSGAISAGKTAALDTVVQTAAPLTVNAVHVAVNGTAAANAYQLQVQDDAGGVPSGTALATAHFPATALSAGGWITIALPSTALSGYHQYHLVFTSTSASGLKLAVLTPAVPGAGLELRQQTGAGWQSVGVPALVLGGSTTLGNPYDSATSLVVAGATPTGETFTLAQTAIMHDVALAVSRSSAKTPAGSLQVQLLDGQGKAVSGASGTVVAGSAISTTWQQYRVTFAMPVKLAAGTYTWQFSAPQATATAGFTVRALASSSIDFRALTFGGSGGAQGPGAKSGEDLPFVCTADIAGAWPFYKYDLARTGTDRLDTAITPQNVSHLRLKWSHTIPYPYTYNTEPTVANGLVYEGGWDDTVSALDATAGKLRWSYTLRAEVVNTVAAGAGLSILGNNGGLFNFGSRTGQIQAGSLISGSYRLSTAAVYSDTTYVGTVTGTVMAVNPATGGIIWSAMTDYLSPVTSEPAFANGAIYAASNNDHGIFSFDAATGARIWSYTTGNIPTGPAVANGIVYAGSFDHNVYALDAKSGAVKWTYTTGYFVFGAPAVDATANTVVAGSEDGVLYALNAQTGTPLWTYKPTTGAWIAAPIIANGIVYAGNSRGAFYALNESTGKLLWHYQAAGTVGSATLSGNMLYVSTGSLAGGKGNDTLFAFGL